jgi:hypothetical protein
VEQSPSWEANRFAASQETPRILQNPKVHYHSHKCPPPVPILSQLDPVHTTTFHYLKVHLNVTLPSTSVTGYEGLSAISLCGDVSEETATGSLLCTTSLLFKPSDSNVTSAVQQKNSAYRSGLLFHEHVLWSLYLILHVACMLEHSKIAVPDLICTIWLIHPLFEWQSL